MERNGWSSKNYGTFWTTCVHKAIFLVVGAIEQHSWVSGSTVTNYRNAVIWDRDGDDVFIHYEAEMTFVDGHAENVLTREGVKILRHPTHYSLYKVTHRDPRKFTEHIPAARFMG